MTYYDPEVTPDPQDWLALDEQERMRVVKTYHVSAHVKVPNQKAHSALRTIVGNQIATGFGPSKRALARLQIEGLSRHEAIHAICSKVAKQSRQTMVGGSSEGSDIIQARFNSALDNLTAEGWRTQYD